MSERRMTASERRSQLLDVAKTVFAEMGYDGTTVEEIAARASVSKPVVYGHFGGKEGIYAVIVDRESARLLEMITSRLGPGIGAREQVYTSALAFLDYIEADPAGFRVLTRDSPAGLGGGGLAGLLGDVAAKAEEVLRGFFTRTGVPVESAPLYAHALVGMVVHVGGWWAEVRVPDKDTVARNLTELVYHGLQRLPRDPARSRAKRRTASLDGTIHTRRPEG
jgi:AcrR family transcriptional regulator